jgi:hypothetical protein
LQGRLDAIGDEFLESRDYLERDGLTHYREVLSEATTPWKDPWGKDHLRSHLATMELRRSAL